MDLFLPGRGQHGQVIDVLLSARNDLAAAKHFFTLALRSLHRKRSSDWSAKNQPDLRNPLTESNRRPSPYHGPPEHRCGVR